MAQILTGIPPVDPQPINLVCFYVSIEIVAACLVAWWLYPFPPGVITGALKALGHFRVTFFASTNVRSVKLNAAGGQNRGKQLEKTTRMVLIAHV